MGLEELRVVVQLSPYTSSWYWRVETEDGTQLADGSDVTVQGARTAGNNARDLLELERLPVR